MFSVPNCRNVQTHWQTRPHIDSSSIVAHLINFYIQLERSLKYDVKNLIYQYNPINNQYGFFFINRQYYIWTWMALNNINTQSYDLRHTDLFSQWNGLASQIHVNRPQCFMSIFLLKSDDGMPQNMHFNVFVIDMCSLASHPRGGYFQLCLSRLI